MPVDQNRRMLVIALLATPAILTPLASAHADDRPVTAEELRQIEATLRREGFTRWAKVEFDDGRFEVDDAIAANGQKYDLKLSSVDFSILSRDLDD